VRGPGSLPKPTAQLGDLLPQPLVLRLQLGDHLYLPRDQRLQHVHPSSQTHMLLTGLRMRVGHGREASLPGHAPVNHPRHLDGDDLPQIPNPAINLNSYLQPWWDRLSH
jgi:hypothetical protein